MLTRIKSRVRQLKAEVLTLYFAVRDPRTPWTVRALVAFIVAYAASPIDLIPDFIPVIGWLDELLLLPALIALAIRLTPTDVLERSRARAREAGLTRTPASRAGALFIVLIWLVVLGLLGQWCWEWWFGRNRA
jgi:uncharacterized membrane protein YkvA (DUF1232 family)